MAELLPLGAPGPKTATAPKPAAAPRTPSPKAQNLPVSYRLIFWVALLLTIGTFLMNFYLVTLPANQQTEATKTFAESCNSVWKMGVGGFLGLLFGRHTRR